MNKEERKLELTRIVETQTPCMTGITIKYQGERRSFNAYRIPLSFLTYNPYNGRIGAEVKSYERQHHTLNPDIPEDIKVIEDFLWDSKKDANEHTLKSLLEDHQQKHGIVTSDGIIIDGNRRASLLNRIWRDSGIDTNIKQHCQWFIAIVLPVDADKREILRLETTFQMGEDEKVDYGPIEKYLKCGDLAAAGFSNVEIASFMGVKKSEIEMYLNVLRLMNDYLDTYDYTGMYTSLEGNEDSFQKLESALRKYRTGGVQYMWDYSPESDVSDLKSIAFDYIRAGFDQLEFRNIIKTPNRTNVSSSIFADKDIWMKFSANHFHAVEAITEEAVADIIQKHPNGDLKRLLKSRDNAWKDKISDTITNNYKHNYDKLCNKQEAAEPHKLLQKALEALLAIDTTQESFKKDSRNKEFLLQISQVAWEYKKIVE